MASDNPSDNPFKDLTQGTDEGFEDQFEMLIKKKGVVSAVSNQYRFSYLLPKGPDNGSIISKPSPDYKLPTKKPNEFEVFQVINPGEWLEFTFDSGRVPRLDSTMILTLPTDR